MTEGAGSEGNRNSQRKASTEAKRPVISPLLRPRGRPVRWWARLLYMAGAAGAFCLGIAGWLIPIVSGIPFLVLGFALLAASSDKVRQWINRVEGGLPLTWRLKIRAGLNKLPVEWTAEFFDLSGPTMSSPHHEFIGSERQRSCSRP
jgi:hypothetical protein